MKKKPDLIFHLAAIVSGEAEKNFDLGMQVNLQASWNMMLPSGGKGVVKLRNYCHFKPIDNCPNCRKSSSLPF